MRTQRYPSDLTDKQWALVKPLIPVYPGGRPRKTSMRDVLDAIFYVLRTGCQGRFLPKDFPPKSTVGGYFDEWRHNGTREAIHDTLRERVRKQEQPGRPRRTASIDSQSVDTSSGGAARGRDNAQKVDGRKRPLVVDSLGCCGRSWSRPRTWTTRPRRRRRWRRWRARPWGKGGGVWTTSQR